ERGQAVGHRQAPSPPRHLPERVLMAAPAAWLTRVQSAVEAVESVLGTVSPAWALKRTAARAQLERATRGFKAVSKGRRIGENWQGLIGGAERPTESPADLETLRVRARELVRNN